MRIFQNRVLSFIPEQPLVKLCYIKTSQTSTGLYRICADLAIFSGTFDLIFFEAVNFKFIVEKVWFGLVCFDRPFEQKDKINGFWFALVEFALVCLIEFGLVWFTYFTNKQTN